MSEYMQEIDLETTKHFLQPPEGEDTINGYILSNYFIPEEILTAILSHVRIEYLLELSLVCKSWCKLIRSGQIWSQICKRTYGQAPKKNPWYVLYAVLSGRLFYDVFSYSSQNQSVESDVLSCSHNIQFMRNGSQFFRTEDGAELLVLDSPRNETVDVSTLYFALNRRRFACTNHGYVVGLGCCRIGCFTESLIDVFPTIECLPYLNTDKLLFYIKRTHKI